MSKKALKVSDIVTNKTVATKLLSTLFIGSLCLVPQKTFAKITSSLTVPQQFISSDSTVQISGGGNIIVDTSVSPGHNLPAVYATNGASLTGLSIQVESSNDAEGIIATGSNFGAVSIGTSNNLSSITITKGIITSDLLSGATVLLNGVGATTITTSSIATISNTAADGIAISSSGTTNAALTIDNAGTISVEDDISSITINFSDDNGGGTLTVNNTGAITAGSFGTAIKMNDASSSNNSGTINNTGDGEITGAIDIGSNNVSITNDTTAGITGDISATTGDLDITNTSGSIIGNIILGTNSSSSLAINGEEIIGDIILGNSAQTVTFGGGSLSGTINGAGKTGRVVVDTSSLTLGGDIGNSTAINSLAINADNSLSTSTYDVSATTIILNSGSILNVGSGLISSDNISGSSDGVGTVNFTASQTLSGTLGATHALSEVNIADSTVITANDSITATNLNIGGGISGELDLAADKTITGSVTLANGAVFLLNNNSSVEGTIDGATTNKGRLELAPNSSFTATNDIGATTPLSLVLIGNDSTFATTKILNANNIILRNSGSILNLNDGSFVHGAINANVSGEGEINTNGLAVVLGPIGLDPTAGINSITVGSNSQGRFGNSDNSHENTIRSSTISVLGQLDLLDATSIYGNLTTIGSNAKINFSGYSHTINGDFTTTAGSTLFLEVHTPTAADQITTTGALTLAPNTKLRVYLTGTTAVGSEYTILLGGTGSDLTAITDSNISVGNSGVNTSGSYKFTTLVSGNNLLLDVLANSTSSALPGKNSNQNIVCNLISGASAGSSGGLYNIQQYINSAASDDEKSQALDSVLPQIDNSANRIAFSNLSSSMNIISNRISSVSNNSGLASGDELNNKSAWAEVFGSAISQKDSVNSDGYNAYISGLAIGADHEVNDNLLLGVSFAYANSAVKSGSALKKNDIDFYQISAYGGYNFEKFFINNTIGFAWNEYESNRLIPVAASVANADYNGQNYFINSEVGTDLKLNDGFVLTPKATITAAYNHTADYSENGADTLDLHVKNNSTDFFEVRPSLTLSKKINIDNYTIEPEISTSYGYDFAGSKQSTSSNFIGQSTIFDSTANNIARGSLKLGAGAKIYSNNAITMNMNYVFEDRSKYKSNSGMLRMGYKF